MSNTALDYSSGIEEERNEKSGIPTDENNLPIRWVNPSCHIDDYHPTQINLVRKIEEAYRVCYNSTYKMESESFEDSVKFIMDKMNLGHGSPLEHVSFTFTFVTSRSIANEIVRHRMAAYSQESMRYCKYDKELKCILPSYFKDKDNTIKAIFIKGVCEAYQAYLKLRKDEVSPQFARDVLPLCTATKIICTWNLREVFHILDLRYFSKAAHPDMRHLMDLMYQELQRSYPSIFTKPRVDNL